MSKRATSSSTRRAQPHKTRLSWVGLALIVLAGVAVVSIAVWMTQQSQARTLTAPSTANLPAAPVAAAASVTEPATATTALPEGDGMAPALAGPRIVVEQTLYDYGDVHFSTPVETIVRVRNAGSDVLALAENPRVELVEGC